MKIADLSLLDLCRFLRFIGRVAGDLGRLVQVVSHRRCGGEWRTLLDDDGATLEVSSRKLRVG